jgi:hypothetical protein
VVRAVRAAPEARVIEVSDRLAVSAAFSVLMMSVFVLFGPGATRVELGPDAISAPASLVAPVAISLPGSARISIN